MLQAETLQNPCPIEYTMELLSGKWKMRVIWQIAKCEVVRFNQLQRLLGGISNVMLSQTLQQLQQAGVIVRHQYNEVPPRVEYSMTDLGHGLLPVFEMMRKWGLEANPKNFRCSPKK